MSLECLGIKLLSRTRAVGPSRIHGLTLSEYLATFPVAGTISLLLKEPRVQLESCWLPPKCFISHIGSYRDTGVAFVTTGCCVTPGTMRASPRRGLGWSFQVRPRSVPLGPGLKCNASSAVASGRLPRATARTARLPWESLGLPCLTVPKGAAHASYEDLY